MAEKNETVQKTKKSLFRRLISLFVWIIIVFALLIAGLLFALNPILKYGIQNFGPKITGVNVKLDSINVNLLKGRLELQDMQIDNPVQQEFKSEYALKLGTVIVDLDIISLYKPKLVLEELQLKNIRVNFETNILNSNLQEIINNINNLAALDQQEQTQKTEQKETRLQVNCFHMENVSLYLYAKGVNAGGAGISMSVEPIKDIGTGPEGVSPFDLSLTIMNAIMKNALKQGGNSFIDVGKKVGDSAVDGSKKIGNAAVDGTKTIGNTTVEGTKKIGNFVSGGVKGIGGLFNGKK